MWYTIPRYMTLKIQCQQISWFSCWIWWLSLRKDEDRFWSINRRMRHSIPKHTECLIFWLMNQNHSSSSPKNRHQISIKKNHSQLSNPHCTRKIILFVNDTKKIIYYSNELGWNIIDCSAIQKNCYMNRLIFHQRLCWNKKEENYTLTLIYFN